MRIQVLTHALDVYGDEIARGFGPKLPGDAGVDLRACKELTIPAGITEVVPLGVAIELSEGFVGRVVGRSSTLITYDAMAHEGVIDSGYRGEIHLIITAIGRQVHIPRGERVCQLLVQHVLSPELWELTDEVDTNTRRGHHGFGSTGRI